MTNEMVKFDEKGFHGLYPVYVSCFDDDNSDVIPRGFPRLYRLYLWMCFFPVPLIVTGDMVPIYIRKEDINYVD